MQWGYVWNIVYYSYACAIPDPISDTVVVTGGGQGYTGVALTTVVRYGQQGWLGNLPPLITGRVSHACSSFRSSGRLVSKMSGIDLFHLKSIPRWKGDVTKLKCLEVRGDWWNWCLGLLGGYSWFDRGVWPTAGKLGRFRTFRSQTAQTNDWTQSRSYQWPAFFLWYQHS